MSFNTYDMLGLRNKKVKEEMKQKVKMIFLLFGRRKRFSSSIEQKIIEKKNTPSKLKYKKKKLIHDHNQLTLFNFDSLNKKNQFNS